MQVRGRERRSLRERERARERVEERRRLIERERGGKGEGGGTLGYSSVQCLIYYMPNPFKRLRLGSYRN